MNGTLDDFADVCRAYLARPTLEVPAHSNCCTITERFGPVGSMHCYAWCAAFASVALDEAGVRGPNGEIVLHTASVAVARDEAKAGQCGMEWLDWRDHGDVPVGSGVVFDLTGLHGGGSAEHYHIDAFLEAKASPIGTTIAGNWGDRVCRLNRSDLSIVQGFIVWPFATVAPTPVPPTPAPILEDEPMLWLVQIPRELAVDDNEANAWQWTDLVSYRSWCHGRNESRGLIAQVEARGAHVVHGGDSGPFLLAEANMAEAKAVIAKLRELPWVGPEPHPV